jgi:hypothetical protein
MFSGLADIPKVQQSPGIYRRSTRGRFGGTQKIAKKPLFTEADGSESLTSSQGSQSSQPSSNLPRVTRRTRSSKLSSQPQMKSAIPSKIMKIQDDKVPGVSGLVIYHFCVWNMCNILIVLGAGNKRRQLWQLLSREKITSTAHFLCCNHEGIWASLPESTSTWQHSTCEDCVLLTKCR